MMRKTVLFCLIAGVAAISATAGIAAENQGQATRAEDILEDLEDRYAGRNFSADFRQESTLKAMDIEDTASGEAWFKHPGKMRWEYQEPERHVIISDGETLWIHRPADNQVVTGDAAQYFGTGKGASFLADFTLIREAFDVSVAQTEENHWRLKLVPEKKQMEVDAVYLEVNRQTLDITEVITENAYGDTTRIYLDNPEFHSDMEDQLFDFRIPQGADVIEMDEQ
ncbi:MAG: LolA family protein [Desulfobacterales bacterium]